MVEAVLKPVERSEAAGGELNRDLSLVVRWIVSTVGLCAALVGIVCGGSWWRFGSVSAGFQYLAGERLLMCPGRVSFEAGRFGEHRQLLFAVHNLTGKAVRIVGARSSCTCTATESLPLDIPPGEKRDLILEVRLTMGISGVEQRVSFVTDSPEKPVLVAVFRGDVFE